MVEKLTKEQISTFEEVFNMFDKTKCGTVTVNDLKMMYKLLGMDLKENEFKEIIDEIDCNEKGVITFDDFCIHMAKKMKEMEEELDNNEREAWFRQLDRDGNGYIDVEELMCHMGSNGEKFTLWEAMCLINELDLQGKLCVSYEEFVKGMSTSNNEADREGKLCVIYEEFVNYISTMIKEADREEELCDSLAKMLTFISIRNKEADQEVNRCFSYKECAKYMICKWKERVELKKWLIFVKFLCYILTMINEAELEEKFCVSYEDFANYISTMAIEAEREGK